MKLRRITVSTYEQRTKVEELLEKMGIDFSVCAVTYGAMEIDFYAKKEVWKQIKHKLALDELKLFVMF